MGKPSNKQVASRHVNRDAAYTYWTVKAGLMLNQKVRPPREDFEYLVEKMSTMKDERLKDILTGMIAWDDDDRAELETLIFASLTILKLAPPSLVREAFRLIELRYINAQASGKPSVEFTPAVLDIIQAQLDKEHHERGTSA